MNNKSVKNNFLAITLRQLYNLESGVKEGLHLFSKKAHSSNLKQAFNQHEKETENQIKRLEKIFELLNISSSEEDHESAGLIEKGKELTKKLTGKVTEMVTHKKKAIFQTWIEEEMKKLHHHISADEMDVGIMQFARIVEHIEIVTYESLCAFLKNKRDMTEVMELLNETLEEEKKADAKFAALAKSAIAHL